MAAYAAALSSGGGSAIHRSMIHPNDEDDSTRDEEASDVSMSEDEEDDADNDVTPARQPPSRRNEMDVPLASTPVKPAHGGGVGKRPSNTTQTIHVPTAAIASSPRKSIVPPLSFGRTTIGGTPSRPSHSHWGAEYQHPTILTPKGERIKQKQVEQRGYGGGSGVTLNLSAVPNAAAAAGGGSSRVGAAGSGNTTAVDPTESVDSGANTDRDIDPRISSIVSGSRPSTVIGGEFDLLTSQLINTVAPPVAPYTAFSEASRYHDIIHPPTSPRSMLLAKLVKPGPDKPAMVCPGLPVAPRLWQITAKLPAPRPAPGGITSTPNNASDGFDATLQSRDTRLFGGGSSSRSSAPGSSSNGRASARARKLAERAQLAHQQSIALSMGMLPGDLRLPSGVSPSTPADPWSSLHLTPRPRTSNDTRGRREVLHMLDAFRHTPKGVQVLARKEAQREVQRERQDAERQFRETGIMPPPNPNTTQQRTTRMASAPSSQQKHASGSFTARSASRGSVAFGSSGRTGSSTSRPQTSAFGQTGGFFPAEMSNGVSSFHAHLQSTARHSSSGGASSSSSSGLPSTSSFHRVLPPAFMNVPHRIETLTVDTSQAARERLRAQAREAEKKWQFGGPLVGDKGNEHNGTQRAKSVAGIRTNADEEKDGSLSFGPATSRSAASPSPLPAPGDLDLSSTMASIRDYSVRALACQRAGRRAAEANAQYCMGVLYDNIKHYHQAIECYRQFKLILCGPKAGTVGPGVNGGGGEGGSNNTSNHLRSAEDSFADALAHNSLGVSFQNLGADFFPQALYHHARHREIADIPGQFIAYTNMGLIYQLMASNAAAAAAAASSGTGPTPDSDSTAKSYTERAAYHHQQALRCALSLSSLAGQNIAIGNLGLTGLQHSDLQTARACMERHLQLSQSLDDYRGQTSAYKTLGTIATQEGQHEEAMVYYQSAQQMANVCRDGTTADQAKVQVGVAKANAQMDAFMRHQAQLIVGGGE